MMERLNILNKFVNQKIVRKITTNVTCQGYDVTLCDYSCAYKVDDSIYIKHYELWEALPRGCCFIEIKKSNKVYYSGFLNGLRKFGYKEDTHFKLNDKNEYSVYTEKENGECFHITAVVIDDIIFWIGGSKNVHICITDYNQDIKNYTKDRFTFSNKFMKMFLKDNLEKFAHFLFNNSFTACAEICSLDNQHLVDYQSDCIKFFALVPKYTDTTLCVNPIIAKEYFSNLGLSSVDVSNDDLSEFYKYKENSEGAVVYICENNNVVFVYKWKNDNYVFRRAIREQMRKKASNKSIENRINNLHFTHENKDLLLEYYLQFNAWLRIKELKNEIVWNDIFSNWVSLEKEFNLIPDKHIFISEFKCNMCVLILVSPFPGLGKSTIANVLKNYYNKNNHYYKSVSVVNQDDIGNRKLFLKKLNKEYDIYSRKLLIVDKTNATVANRNDYNFMENITWVVFQNQGSISELKDIARSRIISRNKNHNTLTSENKNLDKILDGFENRWEPLKENNVIYINPLDNIDVSIKKLICKIEEPMILECIDYVKECEKNFNVNKKSFKVNKKCKTKYWSLEIDESIIIELIDKEPQLKKIIHENKDIILLNTFHVTLFYFNEYNQEIDDYWKNFESKHCSIFITGIGFDENAIALTVSLLNKDTKFLKPNLHITLGTLDYVSPVYSNCLDTKIHYEHFYEIDGIIKRNF